MRRSYHPIGGWRNFPEPEKFLQFVYGMLSEHEWQQPQPTPVRAFRAKCDGSRIVVIVFDGIIERCRVIGIAAIEVFEAIALRFELFYAQNKRDPNSAW